MSHCIFCKIVAGDIPATLIYEDDDVIAFNDIHPKAAVHFMIVPKKHIESLQQATADDQSLLGKILLLVPQIAAQQGLAAGFKTAINTGKAGGQEVFHLHIHVYGAPQ